MTVLSCDDKNKKARTGGQRYAYFVFKFIMCELSIGINND